MCIHKCVLADEAQAWWYEIVQVLKRTTFAFLAIFVASASMQCDHVHMFARMRPTDTHLCSCVFTACKRVNVLVHERMSV